MYAEAIGTEMEVRAMMTRCKIEAGRRAPVAPIGFGGMGIFLGPMYY